MATSVSVGVCTRPSETAPSNAARSLIDAARVEFIPTSQSASERERAASSSGFISSPGRRCLNASVMAALVIEESQSRSTGLSTPAVSNTYAKINSPSRPASQALTIRSISGSFISLWIALSCFPERSSIGTSLNFSGTIGRSA